MKHIPPKKARMICLLLLLGGAAIGLMGALLEVTFITILGFIALFGSMAFHFIFYRCPHCEKFLDRSSGDYCPYCGRKLE